VGPLSFNVGRGLFLFSFIVGPEVTWLRVRAFIIAGRYS